MDQNNIRWVLGIHLVRENPISMARPTTKRIRRLQNSKNFLVVSVYFFIRTHAAWRCLRSSWSTESTQESVSCDCRRWYWDYGGTETMVEWCVIPQLNPLEQVNPWSRVILYHGAQVEFHYFALNFRLVVHLKVIDRGHASFVPLVAASSCQNLLKKTLL